MQRYKFVLRQTVRRYRVSYRGIKFSSATNYVGEGKSAYDIYKDTTTDNPVLSEADWIASLYGQDGQPPTIGPNGNWFTGGVDTGVAAATGNVVPEKPYFNVPMRCPIPYVGLESEIDEGWSLCDGRNVAGYGVTPDMRGRFIVGADPRTPSIPTNSETNLKNYGAVGNTGGSDNVLLTASQSGLRKHWHFIFKQSNENTAFLRDGKDKTAITDGVSHYSDNNNMYAIQSSAGEADAGKSSEADDAPASEAHENRPPYYVAAFIIRTTYQNANGGKSAYDIAKLNGFAGTEAEWLASLMGKSAYQIALDYGFVGTIEEWILSLKGGKGDNGRGIIGIARTSGNGAAGTTDTYTISYSNNTSSTYQVVNGTNGIDGITPHIGANGNWYFGVTDTNVKAQGINGKGISSFTLTSGNGAAGTTDTYTITYTDTSTTTLQIVNGANGNPGTNGRGITSILRTSGNGAAGTTDTYTITLTDNSTTTFNVVNGANGVPGTPGTTLTADQLQIINTVPLVCSDEKTDLTASTDEAKIRFVFQTAQSFTKIVGELNTAAAGGTLTVVAKKNGVSFLSTNLTFDSGENTTRTAAVPFVFSTPTVSFAVGDYVEIFVTIIGAVTPGKGLKIYLM